jgi:hypothetical protein
MRKEVMTVHSTMQYRLALAITEERRRRMRRTSLLVAEPEPRRPVRRWIGRQLVSFGLRLSGEPTMRPARAR